MRRGRPPSRSMLAFLGCLSLPILLSAGCVWGLIASPGFRSAASIGGVTFLLTALIGFVSSRRKYTLARRRLQGRTVFVYTNRRGWNEFIANNVVPQLGPWTLVRACRRSDLFGQTNPTEEYLLCDIDAFPIPPGESRSRPYLITFGVPRRSPNLFTSLHAELLPFKSKGRRDPQVQAAVRPLLVAALRRHGVELDPPE